MAGAKGGQVQAIAPVSPVQMVLLSVDGQSYALPLAAVERVLRMVEVTPLPGAPDAVAGIVNIHGELIPTVSIRARLGLAPQPLRAADSLVVARARTRRLAIIAESVLGVVERPADAFVSSGDIARGIQHIEGVLKTSDGLVLVQDLDRFLSSEEEQSLDLALEK
jgi:purine-binding chemotaxis protein CheW